MFPLLLFDLDGTLVDRSAMFRSWAAEFAAAQGQPDVEWLVEAEGDGLVPRAEFFAAVRVRFGLSVDVDDLLDQYRGRLPEFAKPRQDVLDALAALRARGHRLGVVTNGEPGMQLATLRAAGLEAAVDGWAVSGAEGVRKPDPAIFRIAAGRCGAALDGGWMIGDSAAADIAGGQGAGLRTAWIRRGRAWDREDLVPDLVVDDVVEVLERVV